MRNVKTLFSGDSFGELSLIDNRPRAATVRCSRPTLVATLSKK